VKVAVIFAGRGPRSASPTSRLRQTVEDNPLHPPGPVRSKKKKEKAADRPGPGQARPGDDSIGVCGTRTSATPVGSGGVKARPALYRARRWADQYRPDDGLGRRAAQSLECGFSTRW